MVLSRHIEKIQTYMVGDVHAVYQPRMGPCWGWKTGVEEREDWTAIISKSGYLLPIVQGEIVCGTEVIAARRMCLLRS